MEAEGIQRPIGAGDDENNDDDDDRKKPPPRGPGGPGGGDGKPVRGYFHTYRAKRDLKLLYLDGMAAGKTGMGTLDTQDFLLRGLKEAPGFGEWDRAAEICEVLTVTNTFVDYPRDADDSSVVVAKEGEDGYVREARERCVKHFLTPATVWRAEWTPEDGMVYVAVEAVVQRLCGDLFDVRGLVLRAMPALVGAVSEAEVRRVVDGNAHGHKDDDKKLEGAVTKGRKVIQALKGDLGWSTWKKCRPGLVERFMGKDPSVDLSPLDRRI
ncbi:uncharacterized protein N0V96_010742 [Colletotrichum fioriniae]|uniref:uncharacterized protein n=1 Tax=Colletotrichum fioriniae TaxID=710243 RepID=UPI0032D9EA8D|nr:hypothetical protein N0V96_010742 [Colletotrichum fioriniae]